MTDSKLLWNGNEIVYEDNPNHAIAGQEPDQPDELGNLIVDSVNKVKRLEEALLKVNNILFDLEINADKEISGKNIAPVRQVIKQALKEQES